MKPLSVPFGCHFMVQCVTINGNRTLNLHRKPVLTFFIIYAQFRGLNAFKKNSNIMNEGVQTKKTGIVAVT